MEREIHGVGIEKAEEREEKKTSKEKQKSKNVHDHFYPWEYMLRGLYAICSLLHCQVILACLPSEHDLPQARPAPR